MSELCGKRQATKARLNHHTKSVHKESGEIVERNLTCDNCGKRFANQENLGVHNKAVHKKSEHFLFCTICIKKFVPSTQLQTHTAKLHKTISCDLCDKNCFM
jgi:transcriptional regulator NrdR family protein